MKKRDCWSRKQAQTKLQYTSDQEIFIEEALSL